MKRNRWNLTARHGNPGPAGSSGASESLGSGEFILSQQTENRDLALLGALCLFLSALDHLIPKPLPFMRIGLANLPLLIALAIFSAKHFFLLALIKVLGQALITGTLFSYVALFSLTGTMLSAALMFVLYRWCTTGQSDPPLPDPTDLPDPAPGPPGHRTNTMSLIGIGIAGAFVSNAAQLALAWLIVFGEGVRYLAPPFLAAGIISGGALGFFAEAFSSQSEWLRMKRKKTGPAESGKLLDAEKPAGPAESGKLLDAEKPAAKPAGSGGYVFSFRALVLFLSGAFFLVVPYLPVRAALFLVFWFLAFLGGKKMRPLFMAITMAAIVICNSFPPFGKVLFHAGPIILAEGSLLRGLQRAVTMEGLIMFSAAALGSIPPLPGKIGRLLQETFGVLEQLNRAGKKFFSEPKKTGTLLKNLDRLLCELS
jgi:heptaprenyl diphosphate synthase